MVLARDVSAQLKSLGMGELASRPTDPSTPLLENELPDQDENIVNDILVGILEWSCAQQARYDGDIDSDIDSDTPAANIACQPTNRDYHY